MTFRLTGVKSSVTEAEREAVRLTSGRQLEQHSVKSIIMSEDAPDALQMPSYTKALKHPTKFTAILRRHGNRRASVTKLRRGSHLDICLIEG